jgi:amidophosphoribosyltransferase
MTVENGQSLPYKGQELDPPGHECGVFLISIHDGSVLSEEVLQMQQVLGNRGKHASGAIILTGDVISYMQRGLGSPSDVHAETLLSLNSTGNTAIGHNRYGTFGGNNPDNIQPCISNGPVELYIATNGNNPSAGLLLDDILEQYKIGLDDSHSDTYIITQYLASMIQREMASSGNNFNNGLDLDSLIIKFAEDPRIRESANNMVIQINGVSYVVTDPYGFHPFFMGKYREGVVFASETTAFDVIGAKTTGTAPRGAVIRVENGAYTVLSLNGSNNRAHCGLDANYMTNPAGLGPYSEQGNIGTHRYDLGRSLGERFLSENPVVAGLVNQIVQDRNESGYAQKKEEIVVVSVPASANMMAYGVSTAMNIPVVQGIKKRNGTPRTFMAADIRNIPEQIANKFDFKWDVIQGKTVILVDDSIVRGNTLAILVPLLVDNGAKEVYVISAFPPIHNSCHYGVAISQRDLIANRYPDSQEIFEALGATGGVFATTEELASAYELSPSDMCRSCTEGISPVKHV